VAVAVGVGCGTVTAFDDPPPQPELVSAVNVTRDARRKCSFFTTSWYASQLKRELCSVYRAVDIVIRAYGVLVLAQLAIGAAAIFARYALLGSGPIWASALRLAIASVPLALFAWLRGGYRGGDRITDVRLVFAGVLLGVHMATWIASLQYTTVAISTLLVTTAPVWTELMDRRARKGSTMRRALAIGVALVGVAVVVGWPSAAGSDPVRGAVLALIGSATIAGYLTIVSHIGDNVAMRARYSTIGIVGRTYPIAAVAVTMWALVGHDRFPLTSDTTAWGGILAMALVSQLLGHTALNAALRTLTSTVVAMTTLLEPIVAALFAAWLFSERLSPLTTAGGILVLVGIGLLVREEGRAA